MRDIFFSAGYFSPGISFEIHPCGTLVTRHGYFSSAEMVLQKTGSLKFGQVERPCLRHFFKIFMSRDICNLRNDFSARGKSAEMSPLMTCHYPDLGSASDWLIFALSRFKVVGRHQYRIWDLDAFSSDVIS